MSVENATAGINTTISSITNSTQFVVASATGITTSTALNIGTWVTATVGAQGVQGSTGAQGSQGVQGTSGWQFSAINAETSAYTTVLADATQLITANSSSAFTISIPTNSNVAYPTGTQLNIVNINTGVVTIAAVTSGTTTITSTGGTSAQPKLRTQWSMATAIKTATDTWIVVGDIV